jgi:hypothetical protein
LSRKLPGLDPDQPPITADDIPIPVSSVPMPSQIISLAVEAQNEEAIRPEIFFVPPAKAGGSERVGARISPDYIAAIARLVESGHFGWSTSSDFFRWAVEAGIQIAMKYLRDEKMSNEARVMRAILRRHQVRKRNESFASLFGMIVKDIQDMMAAGQDGDAQIEFEETLRDIEALNVASLRDRLKSALVQEFPGLWGEVSGEGPRPPFPFPASAGGPYSPQQLQQSPPPSVVGHVALGTLESAQQSNTVSWLAEQVEEEQA